MLLRYESWLMLPVIALTLGVLFEQESWGFKSTAILVFMSLVFIGTYMNWLFTEMPIIFLIVPTVACIPETKRLQQEDFWASWLQSFTWIVQVVPVYLLIVGPLAG